MRSHENKTHKDLKTSYKCDICEMILISKVTFYKTHKKESQNVKHNWKCGNVFASVLNIYTTIS